MHPERVLEEQADRNALLKALLTFANHVQTAAGRQQRLDAAGVQLATIKYDDDAFSFATALVARFRARLLSEQGAEQHPLVLFLRFLLDTGLENHGLSQMDGPLFQRLIAQAQDSFGALRARRSVGKIEDAKQNGIGTGVVVGAGLLLTALHIFSKTGVDRARVRFDHRVEPDGYTISPGMAYELDVQSYVSRGGGPNPDYALLRIGGGAARPSVTADTGEVNADQAIRTIHHPKGEPAVISGLGRIVQVGDDYLLHDLPTAAGSSGAPIFNRNWELIALHRGETARTAAGITEAVPIHAFWGSIKAHLTP